MNGKIIIGELLKKICEIEEIDVRVFITSTFVEALEKTLKELKNLLESE